MEITGTRRAKVNEATATTVKDALDGAAVRYKTVEQGKGRLLIRFPETESQLLARDTLEPALGSDYTLALTLRADLPGWLRSIDAEPMYLGLDLRGGIYVLIDVDMDAALLGQGSVGAFAEGGTESGWRMPCVSETSTSCCLLICQ